MSDMHETDNTTTKEEEVAQQSEPTASAEAPAQPKAESPQPQPEVPKAETAVNEKPEAELSTGPLFDIDKMGILNDVYIQLTIEIGRAHIKIRDLLNLTKGSIIELDKLAGEPVGIYANGKLISMGNIITANGKYCIRLTSVSENATGG